MNIKKKCNYCDKLIIGFDKTMTDLENENIDIINDICDCYYSPYKMIDILSSKDEDNNEVLYGTQNEIINKLTDKINKETKGLKYYLSCDKYEVASPFSFGNSINIIIPQVIDNLFKDNLKSIQLFVNIIPDKNFFEPNKSFNYTLINLSFDENYFK